jgi:hypothetical protein
VIATAAGGCASLNRRPPEGHVIDRLDPHRDNESVTGRLPRNEFAAGVGS